MDEWIGLGFTNPIGIGGVLDVCICPHPIFPTFSSKSLLLPTFFGLVCHAVSKCRELLLKCVYSCTIIMVNIYIFISQFGVQYDLIILNLHPPSQIGAGSI